MSAIRLPTSPQQNFSLFLHAGRGFVANNYYGTEMRLTRIEVSVHPKANRYNT
jgi:hypothetical protein